MLGVRIDTISKDEAKETMCSFLLSDKAHIITTPNPEIVVASVRDTAYREALNKADVNICDGRGIELLSKEPIERFPGVDVLITLLQEAAKSEKTVYLLGTGQPEILEKAKQILEAQIPNIRIIGTNPGQTLTYIVEEGVGRVEPESKEHEERIIDAIITAAPCVLVVAFGHPKQELWVTEHLGEFPSVRVAIGIGGALDTIAGRVPRAPAYMRRIGLEWLWRLVHEPKRIKRIITAVIVFPLYVFLERTGLKSFSS